MSLRGVVVDVDGPKTVTTSYGDRDLCEATIRPERGVADPVDVTLWGKWAETAEHLEVGMELAVHGAEEGEYRGEVQYSVGSEGWVVVEPDFLVDVTAVRSWVQCPRMYYLNKIGGVDHAYPVVKGTIVHEVFGDLLRGRDLDESIAARIEEAGLDLGLLGRDAEETTAEVREHAAAIEGWLQQGRLTDGGTLGEGGEEAVESDADAGRDTEDGNDAEAGSDTERGSEAFEPSASEWRSEMTLISERFGLKGRADAVRRGMPVELKTGKNTRREPRFHDKVQATCYALVLGDREGEPPDTGTLLYTKNAAVERSEESGDLSPAKEFSIGEGLLNFVLRARNELAAMEHDASVPTGYEADAKCEYCFEQDTCMAVSGRLDQESKAGLVGTPIPEEERAYFDRFYRAIEHERRAVHREYAKLWEQTPTERADDDRALVELEPVGRRELDGGRWELRANGTGAVSKIREGDLVLASDGDPISGNAELGRVERLGGVGGRGVTDGEDDAANDERDATNDEHGAADVVVTADEPVELRRLDVYPSELTTDRLLTALHDGVLTQSPEGKDVLFERRDPEFDGIEGTFVENNASQDEAVRLAVGARDCALIHGPPGTGKTYTLATVVRALVERGERVLLSAFTNRAVDNAIEALEEQGFTDVVRVGTESGVRADMQEYRLEQSGDPASCAARLEDAAVVAATTATAGSRRLKTQSFDVAVVDEAGQLTEPATLAATSLADRFVLVGDHHQLPPVVRSDADDRDGVADLSRSLFERLVEAYPDASVMLDRQYRMSQAIQAFSSREFYDGQLRPASGGVASQRIADLASVDADALPSHLRESVTFVDPDGDAEGNTNPTEAAAVVDVVERYLAAGLDPDAVGVIAPYRAQVAELDARMPDAVAVDTVDRFQGSSKEVIVISFVATGSLDGPIFEDYRRVNVALTRAKKSLVLVGDATALSSDEVYGRMVEWAR